MGFFGKLKDDLAGYFNISADLDDLGAAKQSIMEGVSFRGSNIIILILAIFVASLGLNTNSAPVIIGAMLISPLMGPIIGIGLGLGTYDFPLVKRAVRNLSVAALFSVVTAIVYFLISPVSEGHSELLARTSPTIYDVLIGFFGGGAGIVAIACKNKGNVIPGVAIATALMPPLCTAGYGIATWQLQYFFGAFYLFLINSIFIAFATLLGVKLFHFKEVTFVDPGRKQKMKRLIYLIVTITLVPSVYLTVMMFRDSYFTQDANEFIESEMRFPNTQVFSKQIYTKGWEKYIDITLIGERLNIDSLQPALIAKMDEFPLLKGSHLKISQGITFDDGRMDATPDAGMTDVFNTLIATTDRQRAAIDSLKGIVRKRDELDSLSYAIAPEIRVLYPEITTLALSRTVMCNVDSHTIDTVNIAIIEHTRRLQNLPQIKQYLETRSGLHDIYIIQPGTIPSPASKK